VCTTALGYDYVGGTFLFVFSSYKCVCLFVFCFCNKVVCMFVLYFMFACVVGDINAVELTAGKDKGECCRLCKQNARCSHFVIDFESMICYLKSHNEGTKPNMRLIRGDIIR
jgi:hypothetical protein